MHQENGCTGDEEVEDARWQTDMVGKNGGVSGGNGGRSGCADSERWRGQLCRCIERGQGWLDTAGYNWCSVQCLLCNLFIGWAFVLIVVVVVVAAATAAAAVVVVVGVVVVGGGVVVAAVAAAVVVSVAVVVVVVVATSLK